MSQSLLHLTVVHLSLVRVTDRLGGALTRRRDERGDVPGWVMVTVMTAAVVAAMLPFVRDEMKAIVTNALHSVTSQ